MKKILLSVSSIISIFYCLRFGYIWTAYAHGGQILGIPFALVMTALTIKYFRMKPSRSQEKLFIFSITYFLTLAAFSLTIEIIRAMKKDYFAFLYYEPHGYAERILSAWVILGTAVYLVVTKFFKKVFNSESI